MVVGGAVAAEASAVEAIVIVEVVREALAAEASGTEALVIMLEALRFRLITIWGC